MNATAIATQAPIIARPWTSESNPGKDYYLLVRRSDNLAIDCTCPDREHRGRKTHRPCKHMKRYNTRVVLQALAEWMSGFAAALQDMAPVTPLEKRTGTVSYTEAVEVLEQYCAEIDAYEQIGDPRKEPTIEEGLPTFLKVAMTGGSQNGRFSGRA